MKTSRFSGSQLVAILKQAEAGTLVPELCREHGISSATFYKWRTKFGGMDASLHRMAPTAIDSGFTRLGMNLTRAEKIIYVDQHLIAKVHVEIFTAEAGVKDFLKNVADLKSGKQYVHLAAGAGLKKKAPATDVTLLKNQHAVDLSKAAVIKEGTEDWYEVSVTEDGQPVSGLVKKAEAEIVTQHDWEKLGFQIVEESNAAADGFLDPEDTPQFFKDLFAKIDANHDGEVDPGELADALKSAETRDQWTKLIAHHPTEWKDKADAPKWSKWISCWRPRRRR